METKDRRWRIHPLFWIPVIICGSLLFVADVFQAQYSTSEAAVNTIFEIDSNSLKGFLIKTSGCRIPFMEPYDQSITAFIYKEKQPICNEGRPPLFDSNLTSIYLLHGSLENYTDQDVKALHCCYRPFHRGIPGEHESDNKIVFDANCISFNISAKITDEFITVQCNIDNTTIYTDYFAFIPTENKSTGIFEQKPLNVLIIGIDAVSRLNFHRQMPTTLEFLKNISAVELLGYNKVGDNTFPNLIPVLTGYSEEELSQQCWKNEGHFDNCSFIWNDYKDKGFITSFGEDSAWMGIFNYVRKGFMKQPTDYMWGSFNRISEANIGNSHNMNVNECVGSREVYKVFLDYIEAFVKKMSMEKLPYFGFYWGASLSHDYLNKPNLGDNNYYKLLKNLRENYLNNTVMIVMSDHGIRWGDIRQTYQGRLEERLPFVFMVLPEWYKRQYQDAYNNLVKNTRRLTTPYDLHETIKDFLYPYKLTHNFLQSRYNPDKRGISLFNEIPQIRTCSSAGISEHWCTCQQSVEAATNASNVVEAANFAVSYINNQLAGYAQCSELMLWNVTNARIMTHNDKILEGNDVKDYMLILQTLPGEGIFEITLRSTYNKTYPFEVMGTISRLNLYGKQSACITDFHLKLYCYCKSLLSF